LSVDYNVSLPFSTFPDAKPSAKEGNKIREFNTQLLDTPIDGVGFALFLKSTFELIIVLGFL
jgi:hypothetical protein